MSRRVTPFLVWEEDGDGERAGPYRIRLETQNRWQLMATDRSVEFYPTRTSARNAAAALHRRRDVRRRLVRYLVVGSVSLAVLLLALAARSEPNPEYPAARAVADRFDQAREAVEAGQVNIEQVGEAFEGLEGAAFEHRGVDKLGLAGIFEGDCYGMVWRSGSRPGGVVVRSNYLTCLPDATLIDQPDPPGLTAELMYPAWEYVLPDQERSPVWFLPVVIVSFGMFLGAVVRAMVIRR